MKPTVLSREPAELDMNAGLLVFLAFKYSRDHPPYKSGREDSRREKADLRGFY
jgi:hypothetical protein